MIQLEDTNIPNDPFFKQELKNKLLEKATTLYEVPHSRFSLRLLQFGLPSAVLATIIGFLVIVPHSNELIDINQFIAEAKAYNASNLENGNIHYSKVVFSRTWDDGTGQEETGALNEILDLWEDASGVIRVDDSFGTGELSDIYKPDPYGNILNYYYESNNPKLPGELSYDEELKKSQSQIVCFNERTETDDAITEIYFRLNSDNSIEGLRANKISKNEDIYALFNQFEFNIGFDYGTLTSKKLSQTRILDLIDQYKDNPYLESSEQDENGRHYVVFTFKQGDYWHDIQAPLDPNYDHSLINLYFDADTYELARYEAIDTGDYQNTSKNILTFSDSEYIDPSERDTILDTGGKPYQLIYFKNFYDQSFEQDSLAFEPGCYKNYEKLSEEEAQKAIDAFYTIERNNPNDSDGFLIDFWENPEKY